MDDVIWHAVAEQAQSTARTTTTTQRTTQRTQEKQDAGEGLDVEGGERGGGEGGGGGAAARKGAVESLTTSRHRSTRRGSIETQDDADDGGRNPEPDKRGGLCEAEERSTCLTTCASAWNETL